MSINRRLTCRLQSHLSCHVTEHKLYVVVPILCRMKDNFGASFKPLRSRPRRLPSSLVPLLVKLDWGQLAPVTPYSFIRHDVLISISCVCKAAVFVLAHAFVVVPARDSLAALCNASQRTVLAMSSAIAFPVVAHALAAGCEAWWVASEMRRYGSRQS